MESRGFKHRQIQCLGPTNVNNRYKNKVVGDSPEFCRALDSHGFADLCVSMRYHCSLTSTYAHDDPQRFNMGTIPEVWRTMTRCWEVDPSSERIVEDILALPRVLERVIAARGCCVQDEFLRTVRRHRSADGTRDLDRKPNMKQRKQTLTARACHPDALKGLMSIQRGEVGRLQAIELLIQEVDLDDETPDADALLINAFDAVELDDIDLVVPHVDFDFHALLEAIQNGERDHF
jgi:hypothetical protein